MKNASNKIRDDIKNSGKFAIRSSFKIEGEGGGPSYLKQTTDSKFPELLMSSLI